MNDYEILESLVGGQKIRDMSGITFLAWLATKLNNVPAFSAEAVELTTMVKSPVLGKLSDDTKIRAIRSLSKLGVEIK